MASLRVHAQSSSQPTAGGPDGGPLVCLEPNDHLPTIMTAVRVLLLSGGVDSTALAVWRQPARAVFIDYGQRPVIAEARAARAVTNQLNIPLSTIRLGIDELGGGLLDTDNSGPSSWPSPEWWPYRNQFLITAAAAWALKNIDGAIDGTAHVCIETGTVSTDGARHADGANPFYEAINSLLQIQEGTVTVLAPAIELTSQQLLTRAAPPESLLGWTHSCHRSNYPCGECPGCYKRADLIDTMGQVH